MKSQRLYLFVLVAIFLGGLIGHFLPEWAIRLKPLGDGFIGLMRMLIGPVIFCTVVLGIAGAGDLKKAGRIGIKALLYFEVLSTIALLIGLVVVNIFTPGSGFHVRAADLDPSGIEHFVAAAKEQSVGEFFVAMVPKTFMNAFTADGDLLQVLVVAILFGWALQNLLQRSPEHGRLVLKFVEALSQIFLKIVNLVMYLAPLGAAGAIAFTVGKFGLRSLVPMAHLMAAFYLTCILFIAVVLGSVARFCGFSLWRFLAYIREELMTVLGTSSSETALAPLMQKLEKLGCPRTTVGLVVPAGYSFNLDGTNIYITLAALFVAQALDIQLTLEQQIKILAVATITSKGASGVTGAGFITLAATLAVVPEIPVVGLTLILGIDRFMSEARSLTNIIGNGVATLAISKWEGELNIEKLRAELASEVAV